MDNKKHDPSFCINEFRSWLSKQKGNEKPSVKKKNSDLTEEMIGTKVESRLGVERLKEKLLENNKGLTKKKAEVLAESFKTKGGVISGVEELKVIVEVADEQFILPKFYMKSAK